MYEDASIELEAFAPGSRVFCIASAGCTARALAAAGHEVTAVDINPVQLEYARARAAGEAVREGSIERLMRRRRNLMPLLGWTGLRVREFLSLNDTAAQVRSWASEFDTRRWRWATDIFLSPRFLRLAYASPFLTVLPRNFGAVVRRRLLRAWGTHPNRSNPFAWRLLLGEDGEGGGQTDGFRTSAVHFVCADAASFLESCAPASFNAFTLSNILDGAPQSYAERLRLAVGRAAAPNAVMVIRSFAEPAALTSANRAARDRAMLWGMVDARPVEEQ
jgi:S-adenosylmethionine:diacylglycerol 3-amino-3-carboxypropyl transferase